MRIVKKSPGGTNIQKHYVSSPPVGVGVENSPWNPKGITKPKINSDWEKNSSGLTVYRHFIWSGIN